MNQNISTDMLPVKYYICTYNLHGAFLNPLNLLIIKEGGKLKS